MTLDEAIKRAEEVMVENLEKTKGRNASDPIAMNCFECAKEHLQLEKWLKELKQLREQTKWIPVSERLPESFRFVNCTCHSLIDDREDWVVETCYLPQPKDSPYSDWGNIPMLNAGDCEVVAWMYRDIPEPYKAESEVEDDG